MRALRGGRTCAFLYPEMTEWLRCSNAKIKTKTVLQRQPYLFGAEILNSDGVFKRAVNCAGVPTTGCAPRAKRFPVAVPSC